MNWKHVFDGSKIQAAAIRKRSSVNMESTGNLAIQAGYLFMAFNGIIYFAAHVGGIDYRVGWQNTGLRVKDGEIV